MADNSLSMMPNQI